MNELLELLRELWAARARLASVVLGLACATAGLSVLAAFGDGFDVAMRASLARSGEAMLRWYGGATTRPFAGQPAGRPVALRAEDLDALRSAPGVLAASPERRVQTRVLGSDGRSDNAGVLGVGADWAFVRGRRVAAGGRFLSPADETERRRTAVIGADLAGRLFSHADVVGRTVTVLDQPFTIVGVMPRETQLMQYSGDDALKLCVPFATMGALRGYRTVDYLLARIDDPARGREHEARQRRALALRLGFDPDDRGAVGIANHAAQSQEIRGIVTGTRVFLLLIGALGLAVAAVGVANMTFALVEERVREFGLRLALGATPGQIRARQLLETALVVGIGGVGGLLGATALLQVLARLPLDAVAKAYLGDPTLSLPTAAGLVLLLGICAGLAGWQPAARAAAVQPVEALRHD
jgi:putative ABC transport system permease protein